MYRPLQQLPTEEIEYNQAISFTIHKVDDDSVTCLNHANVPVTFIINSSRCGGCER
jgi:hypothetical protein